MHSPMQLIIEWVLSSKCFEITWVVQQQSMKKAAEVAAGEVIQDAQDYVAAESAAIRSKQARSKSVEQLTAQGELCRPAALLYNTSWFVRLCIL